jgi:hypothetical protein
MKMIKGHYYAVIGAIVVCSSVYLTHAGPTLSTKDIKNIYIFDLDNVVIDKDSTALYGGLVRYITIEAPHKFSLLKCGIESLWERITGKAVAAPQELPFTPDGTSYRIADYLKHVPHGKDYFLSISELAM